MLVNELKLVKLWYGFDSGFMNVIIFVKKMKKKWREKNISI